MELKRGQLVKNVGAKTFRLAIVSRVWQSKPSFSPQVEVIWIYYPSHPEMVGQTTQMDSRRFKGHSVGPSCGYEIIQDETGKPAAPLER
jgi:hypothetical protein